MSESLKGRAASKGIAYGKAVYVDDPEYSEALGNFEEGDILITGMTDIDYMPIIRKASAVVTSLGGKFSHASVICQQLKKPCVVGIVSGLFKFSDMKITVNGTTGEVFIGKRDI